MLEFEPFIHGCPDQITEIVISVLILDLGSVTSKITGPLARTTMFVIGTSFDILPGLYG